MRTFSISYFGGHKIEIKAVLPEDYIKQPHYRDEWGPPMSLTGKILNASHTVAVIVDDVYLDFA
jgi:hypothetical protein